MITERSASSPDLFVQSPDQPLAPVCYSPQRDNFTRGWGARPQLINQFLDDEFDESIPGSSTALSRITEFEESNHDPLDRNAAERRADSLKQFKADIKDNIDDWGHYMQLKKDKLNYQVNVLTKPRETVSEIFKGVSIFVNGHTVPTALVLRELIQCHGGRYHCYQEPDTTYIVASCLANGKINSLRKTDVVIRPEYFVDSIAAGRRLAHEPYLLLKSDGTKSVRAFFDGNPRNEENEESLPGTSNPCVTLDARDPNFIQEFYARSRLHLISTLAQEMKQFVTSLRENCDQIEDRLQRFDSFRGEEKLSDPVVFHIDLDCFFVSVALRTRPDLQGKPVAITHSRGSAHTPGFAEVASCSYAARAAGLKNGMLVRDALKLCPSIICLPYQFEDYKSVSKIIYTIVSKYSLVIRAVSCDEMFINFTELCQKIPISDVVGLAELIRSEIRKETGCPASVGIGPNCTVARLATRKAKPDGVYWVNSLGLEEFMALQKVADLPGVGYATVRKLENAFGPMPSCADLQQIPLTNLVQVLGKKTGLMVYQLSRGKDDSLKSFDSSTVRKSVSCDVNYGIRFTHIDEVKRFFKNLSEELSRKLLSCGMLAGSITLKLMIRSPDAPLETAKYLGHGRCDVANRSGQLANPTLDPEALYQEALKLFTAIGPPVQDLRGIGVQCGRLSTISSNKKGGRDGIAALFAKIEESKQDLDTEEVEENEQDEEVELEYYEYSDDQDEEEIERETRIVQEFIKRERDKELPYIKGPAFNGQYGDKALAQIKLAMSEEPTEEVVNELRYFFTELGSRDNVCRLRKASMYLTRLSQRPEFSKWQPIIRTFLLEADVLLEELYGSPMAIELIDSEPFCK